MKKSKTKRPSPPETLSAAIFMALKDLEWVEKSKLFTVQMGNWFSAANHKSNKCKDKCEVCFAGSVMAKTLKSDPKKSKDMASFGKEWKRVFNALDFVREYQVSEALNIFDDGDDALNFVGEFLMEKYRYENPLAWEDGDEYQDNPDSFKKHMLWMATEMEKLGY